MQVLTLRSLYTHGLVNIPYQEEYASTPPGTKFVYTDEAEDEIHEEIATLESTQHTAEKDDITYTIKLVRPATDHDLQLFDSYQDQARQALRKFHEIAKKYSLPMHTLRSTYSLNGNRVHFIFVADERVDFREFVKDLARTLKKKIYLRQIGPRDRARLIDGYGRCGRHCCCSQFLVHLPSVNMDSARAQGLSGKGASKLLGCCGKLLCCLNYEVSQYLRMSSEFPAEKSTVTLKKDKTRATVLNRDILNNRLKVITDKEKILYLDLEEIDFPQAKKAKPTPSTPDTKTEPTSESAESKS